MMLVDHTDARLTFDAAGEHSAVLEITNESEVVVFTLRPDSAVAIAAVLFEWAHDRTEKGGLF